MLTELELKARLKAVAADGYKASEDAWPLMQSMLAHIGAIDPELRDDLIYTCSYHWIVKQKVFDTGQLNQMLDTILDEHHLFHKLGDKGEDSVFTRTFSVLQLPLLLYAHREQPYISEEKLHQVLDRVLAYLKQEQDLRGHVQGKGWAHAVAHTADALEDLAQCQEFGAHELHRILQATAGKLSDSEELLLFEEDERLVTAVMTVIQRAVIGEDEIAQWLDALAETGKADKALPPIQYFNIKHFLRSLYFRLQQEKVSGSLVTVSLQAAKQVGRFNK